MISKLEIQKALKKEKNLLTKVTNTINCREDEDLCCVIEGYIEALEWVLSKKLKKKSKVKK